MCVRRCPTLPQGLPCSTIGAASLSFRVRNVSGRFPRAMAAETLVPAPTRCVGWCGGLGAPVCPAAGLGGRVGWGCCGVVLCWVSVCWEPQSGREQSLGHTPLPYNDGVCGDCQVIGVLVPVSCTSLSSLLPHPAYQPSRLLGASPPKGWKSHLEAGFPLRCFQRLSIPNVANQRCSWRNNWHTRGSSNPVLSY